MKKINFIAFLGLYLAVSPQAMGREQRSMLLSKMVIEVQVRTPQYQEQKVKKFPFPKKYRHAYQPTFCRVIPFQKNILNTHASQPIVVNVRKNIPPKIIEESSCN